VNDSFLDPAEDLSDDAILAHAAPIHAPPTRARVGQVGRSVMIAGSGERTVVLSRRALLGPSKPRTGIRPWLLWSLAGLVAFAAGGVVSSALSAERKAVTRAAPAVVAKPAVTSPSAPATAAPEKPIERVRVVSVGDLPLESAR
jgi:hypothetical protein